MDSQEKWNAVLSNDKQYDGRFFYAVTSTRIFCRPSCPSKPPLKENVVYFPTAEAAMARGYRPCKRCRPDLLEYAPNVEIAGNVKSIIDKKFADKTSLINELEKLGISRHHMNEVFMNQYGQTLTGYVNTCRILAAREQLDGDPEHKTVLDISLSLGFESLSSFYTAFKKNTGMAPGEYRKRNRKDNPTTGKSNYYTYDLALGRISIASDGVSLTAVQFTDTLEGYGEKRSSSITDSAAKQLEEYFDGKRKVFELPCNPKGSAFQKSVWAELQRIPYGSTKSYKQVAERIGNPKASRAVGMANNKNPLLIVIPCHRVTGTNGSLVGYAASLAIKEALLRLERLHKEA